MRAALTERLDLARRVGDPAADEAVAEIGREVWSVNLLLRQVTTNAQSLPAGVPESLRTLVLPEVPAWVDPARVVAAQRFADRHLPTITLALFCASLPASYAAAEGARILAATGRMADDVDRRVNETACFVLDVLRPHSFEAEGRGRVAAGKVRLVHAGVRHSLGMRTPSGEVPINQEDLLGTLGLFSLLVTDSLTRLGVAIDPRDREDFLHLWCAVGEMMGVAPTLLPTDVPAARELFDAIRRRRHGDTEHGRALMSVLLEGMERHAPPGLRQVPRHLVHHLLGSDLADRLGVPPPSPTWRRAAQGGAGVWRRLRDRAPLPDASNVLGRRLLESLALAKLGGRPATHAIPRFEGGESPEHLRPPAHRAG